MSHIRTPFHLTPPARVSASRYLAALLILPVLASAQDMVRARTTPSAASISTGGALDEMSVTGADATLVQRESAGTALFGPDNLRNVPFSVNVIGSRELENRQVHSLGEALVYDPAVTNSYGATGAYQDNAFLIRGFEIRDGSNTLRDSIPMNVGTLVGTEGLGQIEVLRGPAAFRYGFISPGGIINLVGKRPTDITFGSFTTTCDSGGMWTGHLDLGGKFTTGGPMGYRLNFVGADGQWYVGDINKDRTFVSAALDYQLGAHTVITASFEQNDIHVHGDLFHWASLDVNGNVLAGLDFTKDWGQKYAFSEIVNRSFSLNLESDLSQGTHLSSTTVYVTGDSDQSYTGPNGLAQPNGDYSLVDYRFSLDQNSVGNTTFLTTRFETGPLSHRLIYGGTWSHNTFGYDSATIYGDRVDNYYHPIQFPRPDFAPLATVYSSETDQYGLFVSEQVDIGEVWHALAGVRWARIDQGSRTDDTTNEGYTPSLGFMFDLTPQVRLYASYSQGLEAGGTAPANARNAFQQLDPLESTQYEAGAKIDWLDGKLTIDAALFYITRTTGFLNADNTYVEEGEQRHYGGELSIKGRPFRDLQMSVGLQYLDREIIKSGNPLVDGSTPTGVPDWNATLYADYTIPVVKGLHATLGLIYVGERVAGSTPPIQSVIDPYLRADTGLRYETKVAGHDVTVRVSVENVFDQKYYSGVYYDILEPGLPRTYITSLEVRF